MSEQQYAGVLGGRLEDAPLIAGLQRLGHAERLGRHDLGPRLAAGAYTGAPTNHEARISEAVDALNRAVHDARMALWTVDVQVVEEDPRQAQNGPARIVQVKLTKEF